MVGFGEQNHDHASLTFFTAVTKKIFKDYIVKIQNWWLDLVNKIIIMLLLLIFIADVTKKCKFGEKIVKILVYIFRIGGCIW